MSSLLSLETYSEASNLFSQDDLLALDRQKVPAHVAVIMDGNRRWAKKRGFSAFSGHKEGVEALMNTVEAAKELGVQTLTVYAFSTENWNRSALEVQLLIDLFETALLEKRSKMIANGVRLHAIGSLEAFPDSFLRVLDDSCQQTRSCKDIDLVLALNYGGRDEICRAMKSMMGDLEKKKISKNEIDQELFSSYLDTAPWGDPDLVLRTSGENRISNFLLWQISYAEVYVTDVLWPDFKPKDFLAALLNFQERHRRMGAS